MSPRNDQIVTEAVRRREAVPIEQRFNLEDYVIEVLREGWTPPEPEPVDPDVLAFREWETRSGCSDAYRKAVLAGKWDHSVNARAYLAGARMAREQERGRALVLVEYVETDARRLDGVGGRALAALAKYRGEA